MFRIDYPYLIYADGYDKSWIYVDWRVAERQF